MRRRGTIDDADGARGAPTRAHRTSWGGGFMTRHAMRGLSTVARSRYAPCWPVRTGASAAGKQRDSRAAAISVGGEWSSYNKSPDGQRYSPLRQINSGNAAELAEVCRIRIEDHGSFQAGLVVINDVMYATTSTDTIALDPGHLRGQMAAQLPPRQAHAVSGQSRRRLLRRPPVPRHRRWPRDRPRCQERRAAVEERGRRSRIRANSCRARRWPGTAW